MRRASDYTVTVSGNATTVQDVRVGALDGTDTLNSIESIRFLSGLALRGTDGGETLTGGTRDDLLVALGGDDILDGGTGDDILLAGFGDDTVAAGDGRDVIDGGGGLDCITGGLGRDVFLFFDTALSAMVTVTDFTRIVDGDIEKFDVSGIDADRLIAGDQSFRFIRNNVFGDTAGELRLEQQGTDVLIEGDVDGASTADFSLLVLGQTEALKGWFVL